jgi:type I restriction enzyme, S subunit
MELENSYKKTEVGIIPNDWQIVELGDICFPSRSRINPVYSRINYKCIELEHLSQGSGRLLGHAQSKDLLSQKTLFTKGDVLFGKLRPYLRKFLFAEFDGVCTTEIWVLKCTPRILNKFLYQLIQSDRIIEAANISTGTKMPRAEWKTVSETKVPIPPVLNEQTAIATALSDADALLNSLEKLIAKKRAIKQGAMQELLKTKKEWTVKTLGDVCEKIQDGNYGELYPKSHEFISSGIPFLTSKAIGKDGTLKMDLVDYISQSKHAQLAKAHIFVDDVLFTNRGASVGAIGYVDSRISGGNIGPQLTLLRANQNIVTSRYLFHYLKSNYFQNQIIGKDSGSAMNFFGIGQTSNFKIPLPPMHDQINISVIFEEMDLECNFLESKLSKYRQIKSGMMQNLLTGKIRLV